jgi:chromosome partitioning protein
MPTIVFASPKGGVGKSTSAVLLATELAVRGVDVTIIDADPNRPVSRWAKRPNKPPSLTVVADVTQETIIPRSRPLPPDPPSSSSTLRARPR